MLFTTPSLGAQEETVVAKIGELRLALRYAVAERRRWTGLLRRTLFARNIRGSNSIEGYELTLDDALTLALMEDEELLDAAQETKAAVLGYRNAMTYVLQLADDQHFEYSEGLINSLHFMMLSYMVDKGPGRWRPGTVYVRDEDTGEIVYEGPDPTHVPGLMSELVAQLNDPDETPAIVRASMAHLDLAMIHPFRDGNGRMARALQTLVLARDGILAPEFASIEEYLGRNTPEYYTVLAHVGRGSWQPTNDALPWLRFCLTAHYRQARTVQQRMQEAEQIWGQLEDIVEGHSLNERTLSALYYAALGFRVRNAMYRADARINELTATRDLALLADKGLLTPFGERRGRFYLAGDQLRSIRSELRSRRTPIEDPFSD